MKRHYNSDMRDRKGFRYRVLALAACKEAKNGAGIDSDELKELYTNFRNIRRFMLRDLWIAFDLKNPCRHHTTPPRYQGQGLIEYMTHILKRTDACTTAVAVAGMLQLKNKVVGTHGRLMIKV